MGSVRPERWLSQVDEVAIDEVSVGSESVRAGGAFGVDVKHLMSVCDDPVGDKHAVTLRVGTFGAHVSRP